MRSQLRNPAVATTGVGMTVRLERTWLECTWLECTWLECQVCNLAMTVVSECQRRTCLETTDEMR